MHKNISCIVKMFLSNLKQQTLLLKPLAQFIFHSKFLSQSSPVPPVSKVQLLSVSFEIVWTSHGARVPYNQCDTHRKEVFHTHQFSRNQKIDTVQIRKGLYCGFRTSHWASEHKQLPGVFALCCVLQLSLCACYRFYTAWLSQLGKSDSKAKVLKLKRKGVTMKSETLVGVTLSLSLLLTVTMVPNQ